MSYLEVIKEENEGMEERYELAVCRIREIAEDTGSVKPEFCEYFKQTASFLLLAEEAAAMARKREKIKGSQLK